MRISIKLRDIPNLECEFRIFQAEPDVGIMGDYSEDHNLLLDGAPVSRTFYDAISEDEWSSIYEQCDMAALEDSMEVYFEDPE